MAVAGLAIVVLVRRLRSGAAGRGSDEGGRGAAGSGAATGTASSSVTSGIGRKLAAAVAIVGTIALLRAIRRRL